MKDEFIPYDQALALKKLGFNEPCLAKFMLDIVGDTIPHFRYNYSDEGLFFKHNSKDISNLNGNNGEDFLWSAPLFYQAFKWFRKEYSLQHEISQQGNKYWLLTIIETDKLTEHGIFNGKTYDLDDLDEPKTYEEAELMCLKKLIEIANGK